MDFILSREYSSLLLIFSRCPSIQSDPSDSPARYPYCAGVDAQRRLLRSLSAPSLTLERTPEGSCHAMYPILHPGAKYTFETPLRTITGTSCDRDAKETKLPEKSRPSYISSEMMVHLGKSRANEIKSSISCLVGTFPVGLFGFMRTRSLTESSILERISLMSIFQPSCEFNLYSMVFAPYICGYAMYGG